MMSVRVKHFVQSNHLAIIFLILLIATLLSIAFYDKINDWKILAAIIGGLFSFFYFIQKQQLEELKLFKDLFTEFNERYDKLNNDLNRIKDNKNIKLDSDE